MAKEKNPPDEALLNDEEATLPEQEQAKKTLDFDSTDPADEGRLIHFLRQLAKLCHLRGDMIPQAQENLLRKFFLNRRDRHHLKQISHAHALRSEQAFKNGNAKLALLERIKAWHRMPQDISLLLDVAEAYIEPEGLEWKPNSHQEEEEEEEESSEQGAKKKAARQLFQLSIWQYRRQALGYLKKAVELNIGFKEKNAELESEDLLRLQKLQAHYPKVNWQRYSRSIQALKGRPRRKWPWVLLGLLLMGLLYLAIAYLPWRVWFAPPRAPDESKTQESQVGGQALLSEPVPVEWGIAPEQDSSFAKGIQKSQRLKLTQFQAYEVQGHIRVKPSKNSEAGDPARPFDLKLNYRHRGKEYQKTTSFSYSAEDPNEVDRAIVLEGDTVLFREVFRLPPEGPDAEDLLRIQIAITGPAPPPPPYETQVLPSVDMSGREIPQIELGLRQKLERSDGAKVRMLGYDVYLKNAAQSPLDLLDLRLNWVQEDNIRTKENSPLLLQQDYSIVSPSGTNLPGSSQTTQRLWVEVPEDLNYAPEDWVPQMRILNFAYRE